MDKEFKKHQTISWRYKNSCTGREHILSGILYYQISDTNWLVWRKHKGSKLYIVNIKNILY